MTRGLSGVSESQSLVLETTETGPLEKLVWDTY